MATVPVLSAVTLYSYNTTCGDICFLAVPAVVGLNDTPAAKIAEQVSRITKNESIDSLTVLIITPLFVLDLSSLLNYNPGIGILAAPP
jgi:hypothetical protein